MKNEGIKSKLKKNIQFDNWCVLVGNNIINEKYLNSENIGLKLKAHILNNETLFYNCLKIEIEKEVTRLKIRARKLHYKNKDAYNELGHRLSIINERLKEYNIERTKAFQRNEYVLFKEFLDKKGLSHLHEDYVKTKILINDKPNNRKQT